MSCALSSGWIWQIIVSRMISSGSGYFRKRGPLNSQYRSAIELPSVRTPSQIKKFYEPIMDMDGLDIMDERAAFRPSF